jgi:hypothetical protein
VRLELGEEKDGIQKTGDRINETKLPITKARNVESTKKTFHHPSRQERD